MSGRRRRRRRRRRLPCPTELKRNIYWADATKSIKVEILAGNYWTILFRNPFSSYSGVFISPTFHIVVAVAVVVVFVDAWATGGCSGLHEDAGRSRQGILLWRWLGGQGVPRDPHRDSWMIERPVLTGNWGQLRGGWRWLTHTHTHTVTHRTARHEKLMEEEEERLNTERNE